MREVVIVEAVRTPMGRRGGTLSGVHPNDLGAHVLNEVVKRARIESSMYRSWTNPFHRVSIPKPGKKLRLITPPLRSVW